MNIPSNITLDWLRHKTGNSTHPNAHKLVERGMVDKVPPHLLREFLRITDDRGVSTLHKVVEYWDQLNVIPTEYLMPELFTLTVGGEPNPGTPSDWMADYNHVTEFPWTELNPQLCVRHLEALKRVQEIDKAHGRVCPDLRKLIDKTEITQRVMALS